MTSLVTGQPQASAAAPRPTRRTSPAARFVRAAQDGEAARLSPIGLHGLIDPPPKLADHLRQIAATLDAQENVRLLATPNEPFHAVMASMIELRTMLAELAPEQDAKGRRLVELLQRFATALDLDPDSPVTVVYTTAQPTGVGLEMTPEEWQDLLLLLDRVCP